VLLPAEGKSDGRKFEGVRNTLALLQMWQELVWNGIQTLRKGGGSMKKSSQIRASWNIVKQAILRDKEALRYILPVEEDNLDINADNIDEYRDSILQQLSDAADDDNGAYDFLIANIMVHIENAKEAVYEN
jgi:hypothetical protein